MRVQGAPASATDPRAAGRMIGPCRPSVPRIPSSPRLRRPATCPSSSDRFMRSSSLIRPPRPPTVSSKAWLGRRWTTLAVQPAVVDRKAVAIARGPGRGLDLHEAVARRFVLPLVRGAPWRELPPRRSQQRSATTVVLCPGSAGRAHADDRVRLDSAPVERQLGPRPGSPSSATTQSTEGRYGGPGALTRRSDHPTLIWPFQRYPSPLAERQGVLAAEGCC